MHTSATVLYMHSIVHIQQCNNAFTCGCSSTYTFALPHEQRETSTQFKLWYIIYNTEQAILTLDRVIHQGIFPLHVVALSSVELVIRVLEHYHGALAVAVYLRDMPHLKSTHLLCVCRVLSEKSTALVRWMVAGWTCHALGHGFAGEHYFGNYQSIYGHKRIL